MIGYSPHSVLLPREQCLFSSPDTLHPPMFSVTEIKGQLSFLEFFQKYLGNTADPSFWHAWSCKKRSVAWPQNRDRNFFLRSQAFLSISVIQPRNLYISVIHSIIQLTCSRHLIQGMMQCILEMPKRAVSVEDIQTFCHCYQYAPIVKIIHRHQRPIITATRDFTIFAQF